MKFIGSQNRKKSKIKEENITYSACFVEAKSMPLLPKERCERNFFANADVTAIETLKAIKCKIKITIPRCRQKKKIPNNLKIL